MKTWIASYADTAFRAAIDRLMASAAAHGIQELRPWGRQELEQSSLYKMHKAVLDTPRGGGYWLWKPFLIKETLKEMAPGDVLIYSDAGIEITADLSPLVDICLTRANVLLFSGHYEDIGANLCRKWTKRDCFVYLDCDEPAYHEGQLVDASFMLMAKTERTLALVREWFLCCGQPHLVTDEPNISGLPNYPGFIEHRHDEAIMSLLAVKEGLELFRHPCQHVSHLRSDSADAAAGGAHHGKKTYENSTYGTLLHHHRGLLNHRDLTITLRRRLEAPRERVFDAWTTSGVFTSPSGHTITIDADLRVGGRYEITMSAGPGRAMQFPFTFLELDPPARLVSMGPDKTQVTVEFLGDDDATEVVLTHEHIRSEKVREYGVKAWTAFLDLLVSELEDKGQHFATPAPSTPAA